MTSSVATAEMSDPGSAAVTPKSIPWRTRDTAHQVQQRENIHQAKQVADQNGGELRGRAILVDDAQPVHALPDGLPVPKPLEQDEIRPDQDERDDEREPPEYGEIRLAVCAGPREDHVRGERDDRRDDKVEHGGEATISSARQVVAQDDVIGGLDFESTGSNRHRSMLRSDTFGP